MARTTKTIDDRRGQILEAALRVFARQGFAQTTNADVAREAGITTGLIYHYFENKEALLKENIARLSAARIIRSMPSETLELPLKPLLAMIALQALETVEGEQYVQLLRVYLPELVYHPELARFGLLDFQEAVDFIETNLRSRIASSELRSVEAGLLAQSFMSSMVGFVLRRQIFHDPSALQYSHEEISNCLVAMVLQGLDVE